MMNWLIKTSLKFVSYDTLVRTIAQGLAYVLEYARNSSTPEGWKTAKDTISKVKGWINLFEEVYEDDTLTKEEEKKIQDAIASCNVTGSIYDLLQGKRKSAKKATRKRTRKVSAK